MRICYAVPGALSAGPSGAEELERRTIFLNERASAGTRVDVRDNPEGPASIESGTEELLAAAGLLGQLPALETEGFDALIIGCFGDPGLEAGRELVGVPLVGPAQASMHLAAQLGDRFGIITVVQQVVPTLRRLARLYGLASTLASLRAVDVPVLELRKRRDEVISTLERQGRQVVADGADALALGCMTMGFLDVAAELQERLETPVVNPVLAALHTAEALVRGGLRASRHAYPLPPKQTPVG